jgi:hypothetical protein
MCEIHFDVIDKDGQRRLGNLDGQAILRVRDYKRTNHYKWCKASLSEGRCMPYISHINVCRGYEGPVIETIWRPASGSVHAT